MGNWWSSKTESQIESTGAVANNFVISNSDPINITSFELVLFNGIMCALQIISFIIYVYKCHQQRLKKKYVAKHQMNI